MARRISRIRDSGLARTGFAALRDRRGIAATEFALILPMMVLLFFGMLEVSDAMMASRRALTAANSLTDLIAQERDISTTEIDQVMVGVAEMVSPSAGSTLVMRVSSVIRDPADDNRLIVVWSRDNSGNTPYPANSIFSKLDDDSVVNENASLIVAELDYTYVSPLTHKLLPSGIEFDRVVSRWPRRNAQVMLCGSNPLPTCID